MRFVNGSLSTRIMTRVGLLVCSSLILLSAIVITTFRNYVQQQVIESSKSMARSYALKVSNKLDRSAATTEDLAGTLESLTKTGIKDRQIGDKIFLNSLNSHPELVSSWCIFERNAFDGKDSKFINTHWGNDVGRYGIGYNRALGKVQFDVTDEDGLLPGDGDWYIVPKESAKCTLVNPYTYAYYENTPAVFEASYAVPIFKNSRVIGVAGVDLSLEFLSSLLKEIKPYETGYATIIANDGTLAAHPNASLRGKDIGKSPEAEQMKQAVKDGKEVVLTYYDKTVRDNVYTVLVPINIGKADTPWAFSVTIPKSKAMAPVSRITFICLFVLLVTAAACMIVTKIIAEQIARPIRHLRNVASQIAAGDIDRAMESIKR